MFTRREFIKLCLSLGVGAALSDTLFPYLTEAFPERSRRVPVIWLELLTCTGHFMSFLNALNPTVYELLFKTIDLRYSNTMMFAEGETALRVLEDTAKDEEGRFILLVEGTVPLRAGGSYGVIGHHANGVPITDIEAIQFLAPKAKNVVAVGTCASFGGPYAARPNPSGSVPVQKAVSRRLARKVINVPGCPVHPDWLVGTLTHLLLYGEPELDSYNRPLLFYGSTIHDKCPRRQHFENGIFAKHPGDEGCLYAIGCKGPVTFSDCPTRKWTSSHISWPVEANTPCIGCVSPEFPDGMSPFFEHLPDTGFLGVARRVERLAYVLGGATAAAIGGHLVARVVSGRLHKAWVDGTRTHNPVRTGDPAGVRVPAQTHDIDMTHDPVRLGGRRPRKHKPRRHKPWRRGNNGQEDSN